jgi:hypothetical protein
VLLKKQFSVKKEGEKNVKKQKKNLEKPCRKQHSIRTRVLHKIMHVNPMYDNQQWQHHLHQVLYYSHPMNQGLILQVLKK